ncbi:hypothetical protein P288_09335 [Salmonella enterica subsp. arizonae serovar 18:z4,z23:- str. CVM N7307]|nr:hypothetical protein STU288_06060 [Salmonella enterica subsp. enterica serovar Typhimurium str. U288]AGQ70393.1 hypothetical protein CFSAN001921_07410 [Salmonella enterica subsp. enterica serovar Typhimurium var. 5- str. CFSAN001921]AGQ88171.1 hypothetical protein SE451236_15600 [Salmonella enterica subsp. enterica serovar 4,[5],12:i:- str. 08-1736]AVU70842.1 hypothetical protein FORC58_1892 [Salmonella enterica subsp. enterica serovar Typhimurium]EIZ89730.1 hypothetical protein SEEN539_0459
MQLFIFFYIFSGVIFSGVMILDEEQLQPFES